MESAVPFELALWALYWIAPIYAVRSSAGISKSVNIESSEFSITL
jgi:hypothetical protein